MVKPQPIKQLAKNCAYILCQQIKYAVAALSEQKW
jgi:hypothetical protein